VLAAKDGGPRERGALVEAFLPSVAGVARRYRGSPAVDRTELMQAGVLGLLRALERYDAALGTPFWAYASWWVRQAMQQLVSELTRPVVLSDRALRELARLKDARTRRAQAHGREPSVRELADETGMTRQHAEHLFAAERRPRAMEEPLGSGDDTAATFGDSLADPHAEEAYERVTRRIEVEALPVLLRALNEREAAVVRGRFGLGGPERTLGELAGGLGVSAERVRQIEQKALGKLREAAAL
jgi:RNA polymerase sigma factor (sigma-70 family)